MLFRSGSMAKKTNQIPGNRLTGKRHGMKRVMMFTFAVFCAVCTIAQDKEDLFRQCLSSEGDNYLAIVTQLFDQTDAQNWLSNRMEQAESPEEQCMASILFYRKTVPGAFEACTKLLAEIRTLPNTVAKREQFNRIIPLTQFLFNGRKLEDEYRHGKSVVVMTTNQQPKICPEEDLLARRLAAQLSLIEYYMKFGDTFNDYERMELLKCLAEISENTFHKREEKKKMRTFTNDLYRKIKNDERLSLPVRFEALSKLPLQKGGWSEIVILAFAMLEDTRLHIENDSVHYMANLRACSFFADFGTADDLAKLKALHPKEEWRQKMLLETIQKLEERLEKERTGELTPLDIPR